MTSADVSARPPGVVCCAAVCLLLRTEPRPPPCAPVPPRFILSSLFRTATPHRTCRFTAMFGTARCVRSESGTGPDACAPEFDTTCRVRHTFLVSLTHMYMTYRIPRVYALRGRSEWLHHCKRAARTLSRADFEPLKTVGKGQWGKVFLVRKTSGPVAGRAAADPGLLAGTENVSPPTSLRAAWFRWKPITGNLLLNQ